nr:immunoglobulin heavy chain junction region [Macaca mulatta]
CARQDSNYGSW